MVNSRRDNNNNKDNRYRMNKLGKIRVPPGTVAVVLDDNGEMDPPLDVSLHSTGTEISGVTEVTIVTEITTISALAEEIDKSLSQLERRDGDEDGGHQRRHHHHHHHHHQRHHHHRPQDEDDDYYLYCDDDEEEEHPVNALVKSNKMSTITIDTIPRPSITLQEFVDARVYWFARNVGLAQNQAETFTRKVAESIQMMDHNNNNNNNNNSSSASGGGGSMGEQHQTQQQQQRQQRNSNPWVRFFQDRVDTWNRNMETLGAVWNNNKKKTTKALPPSRTNSISRGMVAIPKEEVEPQQSQSQPPQPPQPVVEEEEEQVVVVEEEQVVVVISREEEREDHEEECEGKEEEKSTAVINIHPGQQSNQSTREQ